MTDLSNPNDATPKNPPIEGAPEVAQTPEATPESAGTSTAESSISPSPDATAPTIAEQPATDPNSPPTALTGVAGLSSEHKETFWQLVETDFTSAVIWLEKTLAAL